MKKTILIILAVLPIVLLIVIAFAGQILTYYQHTPVERVEFADKRGTIYDENSIFTLEMGTEKQIYSRVFPKNASDPRVEYSSSDESICTIDKNGLIKGIKYGTTTITVRSVEGKIEDTLKIEVKATIPFAVTLDKHEITLKVGGMHSFTTIVDAPVAVDSTVKYTSSDPSVVMVNSQGKITARKVGTATITVTTNSGGLTDTCVVTVEEGKLPLYFDLPAEDGFTLTNEEDMIYRCNIGEIDLNKYIKYDELIDPANIRIKMTQGNSYASIDENKVLTIDTQNKYVTIQAYVVDENNNSLHLTQITLRYLK